MPASRFAAWLGARTYFDSGVTSVTGVMVTLKPSNSTVSERAAAVTPAPKEGVTGVTNCDPTEPQEADATEGVPPHRALAHPFDHEAFLNTEMTGVILDTRRPRRSRRYRRDPR
jgi:hypothetical protein